jgi:hypothetical protein
MLFIRGDRTVASTSASGTTTLKPNGSLRTGNQTIAVADAYTVVGNPYAASIDLDAMYQNPGNATVIQRNFWVWDATLGTTGGYRSISWGGSSYAMSGGSGNATDYLKVQTGQAFFVQKNGTGGTLTIRESNKATASGVTIMGNQQVLAEPAQLNVGLYEATGATLGNEMDGALARFGPDYLAAPTETYDVAKINNFNENLSMRRDGNYLSIESRPEPVDGDWLELPFWNLNNRGYAFRINASQFANAATLTAEVQDAFTGINTPVSLSSETIVPFTVTTDPASRSLDRFRIVFSSAVVLPVRFSAIRAQALPAGNEVQWDIQLEENVKHYVVESSSNASQFTEAATVAARNSRGAQQYAWTDKQPANGNTWYRIKAVDNNGNVMYSNTVKVTRTQQRPAITLFPNVLRSSEAITLSLQAQQPGNYNVKLTSTTGQLIWQRSLIHAGNNASYNLPVNSQGNNLPGGYYWITVTTTNNTPSTFKLIIQ